VDNGNNLKQQIIENLHFGRAGAIPGNILARRLGFRTDRVVRRKIRELIADGIPIASSVVYPLGFFIAETKEEVDLYAANIKSRLVEDALRRRDFLRASQNIKVPEQMRLI